MDSNSHSKHLEPGVAIIENDSSCSVDAIDVQAGNKFRWDWLKETDTNGYFLSKYVRKLNKDGAAWCSFCKKGAFL